MSPPKNKIWPQQIVRAKFHIDNDRRYSPHNLLAFLGGGWRGRQQVEGKFQ